MVTLKDEVPDSYTEYTKTGVINGLRVLEHKTKCNNYEDDNNSDNNINV
jgi:hypothetical protein